MTIGRVVEAVRLVAFARLIAFCAVACLLSVLQVAPASAQSCDPTGVTGNTCPTPAPVSIDQALPSNPNESISQMLTTIAGISKTWTTNGQKIAMSLFGLLATIDITYLAIQQALRSGDISEFVGQLIPKILSLGFFAGLINFAPTWIPDIINGFICAGLQIGGINAAACSSTTSGLVTPVDPGQTFLIGLKLAAAMVTQTNLIDIVTNPSAATTALVSALCALLIVIAFAIIAGQLLVSLIEAYFVLGAGIVMLGFTGSRWTVNFGERYLGYAVSMGVKLMTLVLVISLGEAVVTEIASLVGLTYSAASTVGTPQYLAGSIGSVAAGAASAVVNIPTYLAMVGLIGVFLYLAWHIPQSASTLLNGSPTMSLAGVANAATAAAFGAVGAAATVGGLALAGAGAAGGLSKALGSAADMVADMGSSDSGTQELNTPTPVGGHGGGGGGMFEGLPSPSGILALTGGGGSGSGSSGAPAAGPSGSGTGGAPSSAPSNDGTPSGGPPEPAPQPSGTPNGAFRDVPFADPSGDKSAGAFFDAQRNAPPAGPLAVSPESSPAPWDEASSSHASDSRAPHSSDEPVDAEFSDVLDAEYAEVDPADTVQSKTGAQSTTKADETKSDEKKPSSDLDRARKFLRDVRGARRPHFHDDGGSVGSGPVRLGH